MFQHQMLVKLLGSKFGVRMCYDNFQQNDSIVVVEMDYSERYQPTLMREIQSENFGKDANVSMEIHIVSFQDADMSRVISYSHLSDEKPQIAATTFQNTIDMLYEPIFYIIMNNNQCWCQTLRERHHFQNDAWPKWEAVQLAYKLEAKWAMVTADWECWKKVEEGFKNIHVLILFDLDDDDQEDAHWDERIRSRWTVELLQHGQDMDMLPYSPSPSPQQCRSHTKTSPEMKWKEKRRKINRKLPCGKWWKVNQGGGQGCMCKAAQWHQALCDQWSQQGQHGGRTQPWKKPNEQWNNSKQQRGCQHWFSVPFPDNCKGCIDSAMRRFLVDWPPIVFRLCQWGRQWQQHTRHSLTQQEQRQTIAWSGGWGCLREVSHRKLAHQRWRQQGQQWGWHYDTFESPGSWLEEVWQV